MPQLSVQKLKFGAEPKVLYIYIYIFLRVSLFPRITLSHTISETGKAFFQLFNIPSICSVIIITLQSIGMLNTPTFYSQ